MLVVLSTFMAEKVSPVPLALIVAGAKKFDPVRTMPPLTPGRACVMLSDVRVGGGAFTVKERVPEVPPAVVNETTCAPTAALAPIWKVAVMVGLFTTAVLPTAT